MRYNRILVAIDFSQHSTVAAQWVARAFAPGADLLLVHVLELPPPPSFLPRRLWLRADDVETYRARAASRLRQLGMQLGAPTLEEVVRIGRPDEEILRVAAEYGADLVVVGSHHERPAFWNRFGSTAEGVVAAADVPVLIVHGAPREIPRRVLAAVDDSAAADSVITHAEALVERHSAIGNVLHVLPAVPYHNAEGDVIHTAYEWLADRITANPNALTPAVVLGPAAEGILREARSAGADLIVLGRERDDAERRHLLGSVTSAVIRGATCPILVIPSAGRGDAYPPHERAATSSLTRDAALDGAGQ